MTFGCWLVLPPAGLVCHDMNIEPAMARDGIQVSRRPNKTSCGKPKVAADDSVRAWLELFTGAADEASMQLSNPI
ncbi:hypothetical protein [Bradyrhizobium sp. CCBAU 53415]|uniref:hypothetical protein n=1 Tax=Bradyrhizobium sp. CCBAU 53415 TaxID=1325119 RepID=UPI0023051531|nr:hypothetical protein [Bradyrhizobium sp. CCBAU 53415]MDA9463142.1 hypothetical protein [Bradyrhizobium sp. CCBAU 53415]